MSETTRSPRAPSFLPPAELQLVCLCGSFAVVCESCPQVGERDVVDAVDGIFFAVSRLQNSSVATARQAANPCVPPFPSLLTFVLYFVVVFCCNGGKWVALCASPARSYL